MDALTTEALADMAPPVIFYFIVATLGAFTKDLYETMTQKNEKIRIGEILVGGVVATIICYGLSDTWFKSFSLNTMFLITFVMGVLGFEIFGNITNITNIRNLLLIVDEIRKGIPPEESKAKPTSPHQNEDSVANRANEETNSNVIDNNVAPGPQSDNNINGDNDII